jgi:hypothetical protein
MGRIALRRHIAHYGCVCILGIGMVGCAKPIGVRSVGFEQVYQQLNANILSDDQLSPATVTVLHRYDWHQLFEDEPLDVLRRLHHEACPTPDRELLFALSELSYAAGRRLGRQDAYLAAAVYAYFYLLGDASGTLPNPFDRRFRVASDLYNFGLAKALVQPDGADFMLQRRRWQLPVGTIDITTSRPGFPWDEDEFSRFLPADDFVPRGFTSRHRDPGLGMPLVAVRTRPERQEGASVYLPPALEVAATVFLRIQGSLCDIASQGLTGTLELYTAFDVPAIQVGSQTVPLETDVTTPLAHLLERPAVWDYEIGSFLKGDQWSDRAGLWMLQPYQPGKVPVVFVHGTASSPARWAEMVNVLQSDLNIRHRFQFWYFAYTTGNPIIYSAKLLRDALDGALRTLDPQGVDDALRQMVVIGHSQGGLLVKMQVIESGDRLWQRVSDTPIDDLQLTDEQDAVLRQSFFFKPSPYVHRVIFIATPHGGSFMAANWMGRLSSRWVTQPNRLHRLLDPLFQDHKLRLKVENKIPTSVDNMAPSHPFIRLLSEIPIDSDVKRHSIIAVKGQGDPTALNDGVVAYRSAHLDDADSEFVVRSGHSCLTHPLTISEVRRILLAQLDDGARQEQTLGVRSGAR